MTPDQFEGQGGAYVIDPKTGERKLVERTAEQENTPTEPQPTKE